MSSFTSTVGGPTSVGIPGDPDPQLVEIDSADIIPGTQKSLITLVTATDKVRILTSIHVSCRQPGVLEVVTTLTGPTIKKIGFGRVGAGNHNFELKWFPHLELKQTEKVEIFFTISSWGAASDVEMLLQSSLDDA